MKFIKNIFRRKDTSHEPYRKISLVVDITDKKKADWIWQTHLNSKPKNGVVVTGISNGNVIDKLEQCQRMNHYQKR